MATDKVILVSRGAIDGKYGPDAPRIHAAIAKLRDADFARDLITEVIAIDGADVHARFGVDPVRVRNLDDADDEFTDADRRLHKRVVDAVCTQLQPHYVLLIGADDVFPYQRLANAVAGDPDEVVPSDLPYACTQSFSDDMATFVGPTRAVGRLPDIFDTADVDFFVDVLNASARRAPPGGPLALPDLFALSTEPWRNVTEQSLLGAIGTTVNLSTQLLTSPPNGTAWSAAELGRRAHFINCHGTSGSVVFEGQATDGTRGTALTATDVATFARPGTVVATECCYGAHLFDPEDLLDLADGPPPPGAGRCIAYAYLANGAACVVGSTTESIGSPEGKDFADAICREFFRFVLAGESTGNALMAARLAYERTHPTRTQPDHKALAQFLLLGDPSTILVARVLPPGMPSTSGALRAARAERRADAALAADEVRREAVVSGEPIPDPLPPAVQRAIDAIVADHQLTDVTVERFRMRALGDASAGPIPTSSLVIRGRRGPAGERPRDVVACALEIDDTLTALRVAGVKR